VISVDLRSRKTAGPNRAAACDLSSTRFVKMASRDAPKTPAKQQDNSACSSLLETEVSEKVANMIARIMIVGDSNCRDLDKALDDRFPNIKMYVISVGSQTDQVMLEYNRNKSQAILFDPNFIILHTGHNDLAFHKYKNKSPKDSTQTTKLTIDAALEIKRNHPKATTIVSAVFPRALSLKSSLRQLDLQHFNRTAERHTRRLATECKLVDLANFKNNFMWRNKSELRLKTHLFLQDGLHLTIPAKQYLITRWLEYIYLIQQSL
jgi:hypothetical protein